MSNFQNEPEQDPTEITQQNFVNALNQIAEVAPELIEYILTCYPPELMIHMSPEICQHLEALKKSLSHLGPEDLQSFLNSS